MKHQIGVNQLEIMHSKDFSNDMKCMNKKLKEKWIPTAFVD